MKQINHHFLTALPLLLLVATFSGYLLLTYNKYVPIQEGWFQYYTQLMAQGKFPYRDFYLPIPPLFVMLVSFLIELFGTDLIVLRIYGILERCLLIALIFLYLRKYFDQAECFAAVLISAFIYSSFNVDLPYSYYQTSLLVMIMSAGLLFMAIDDFDSKPGANEFYIALAGVFAATGFFIKQSSGILYVVLYVLIILVFFYRKSGIRQALKKLFFFSSGFIAVTMCLMTWLGINNSLMDYYNVVFKSATSKGSLSDILFGFIPRVFTHMYKLPVILLITLVTAYIVYAIFRKIKRSNQFVMTFNNKFLFYWGFSGLITLSYVYPYVMRPLVDHKNIFDIINVMQHTVILMVFVCIALYLSFFLYRWIRDNNDRQNNFNLFTSLISLVWMYSHGMSGVLEVHALLPALPFLVLIMWDQFRSVYKGHILRPVPIAIGMCCIFIISSYRYVTPYTWWGWTEPDVRTAQYTSDIPALRGMYLSKTTKNAYESIYHLIIENTGEKDEVFTFPHIVFFNAISGRTNSNFAPVTYFDVCSDQCAIQSAEYLKIYIPKMVVVMKFPEDAWLIHETLFRGSKASGQRQIIETINIMREKGIYRHIYSLSIGNSYPIDVLLRVRQSAIEISSI